MVKSCKLVVTENDRHQEVTLPDSGAVRLGTTEKCDVHISTGCIAPAELVLTRSSGRWFITCSGGIFFTTGDFSKRSSKQLEHGDELTIRRIGTDETLFQVAFLAIMSSRPSTKRGSSTSAAPPGSLSEAIPHRIYTSTIHGLAGRGSYFTRVMDS